MHDVCPIEVGLEEIRGCDLWWS